MLATQSSISRDLRDLGVRRVKGVYVIKPSRSDGWSFDDVIELVELVTRSGPYTTVIQTVPDAARLVARARDEAGGRERGSWKAHAFGDPRLRLTRLRSRRGDGEWNEPGGASQPRKMSRKSFFDSR